MRIPAITQRTAHDFSADDFSADDLSAAGAAGTVDGVLVAGGAVEFSSPLLLKPPRPRPRPRPPRPPRSPRSPRKPPRPRPPSLSLAPLWYPGRGPPLAPPRLLPCHVPAPGPSRFSLGKFCFGPRLSNHFMLGFLGWPATG